MFATFPCRSQILEKLQCGGWACPPIPLCTQRFSSWVLAEAAEHLSTADLPKEITDAVVWDLSQPFGNQIVTRDTAEELHAPWHNSVPKFLRRRACRGQVVDGVLSMASGFRPGRPTHAFAVLIGQHAALRAVQRQLLPAKLVFANLDDIYVITTPDRVLAEHNLLRAELWRHERIRCTRQDTGVAQVWSESTWVRHCLIEQRDLILSSTTVWRGSALPMNRVVLLGHDDFVHAHLLCGEESWLLN